MLDLSKITAGLHQDADRIWRAPRTARVNYPDEANAFCFSVEEGSFWFLHRNAALLELLRQYPPGGWLADIGGGNGFVSLALTRAGFDTVMIEPGAVGIRNAASRGLTSLVHATLQEADFAPESVPAAGLFDVLEHVDDDRQLLRDVHRTLTPGGRLFLSVPAYASLWSTEDDLVGHHHRYTTTNLARIVEGAGFVVELATYLFAPLPLPILLLRTIPSKLGWRRTLDAEQIREELKRPPGAGSRLLTNILGLELRALRNRRRIPFGSSCLMVARKNRCGPV